jgi:hypothetical protein
MSCSKPINEKILGNANLSLSFHRLWVGPHILFATTAGISDDQRISLSLTAESLPGAFASPHTLFVPFMPCVPPIDKDVLTSPDESTLLMPALQSESITDAERALGHFNQ